MLYAEISDCFENSLANSMGVVGSVGGSICGWNQSSFGMGGVGSVGP